MRGLRDGVFVVCLLALCGDSQKFYEPFRWGGRREDVASLSPDKTMFALPSLLWRDADIQRKLEQMRKGGIPTERYFAFVFKKS